MLILASQYSSVGREGLKKKKKKRSPFRRSSGNGPSRNRPDGSRPGGTLSLSSVAYLPSRPLHTGQDHAAGV